MTKPSPSRTRSSFPRRIDSAEQSHSRPTHQNHPAPERAFGDNISHRPAWIRCHPAGPPPGRAEPAAETAHLLARVRTSMPGIGVRTGARILLEVGDGTTFGTPSHPASHAGLASVTRRSILSIPGEHPPKAPTNSSNARSSSPCSPPSHIRRRWPYHDRKGAQGKKAGCY
jgi:transposase IS116/IS110/IS902 family protein